MFGTVRGPAVSCGSASAMRRSHGDYTWSTTSERTMSPQTDRLRLPVRLGMPRRARPSSGGSRACSSWWWQTSGRPGHPQRTTCRTAAAAAGRSSPAGTRAAGAADPRLRLHRAGRRPPSVLPDGSISSDAIPRPEGGVKRPASQAKGQAAGRSRQPSDLASSHMAPSCDGTAGRTVDIRTSLNDRSTRSLWLGLRPKWAGGKTCYR
jgi:hypothetical protein